MRIPIAATAGGAAALIAASMLGVASAEGPSTTPVRTVSVQGVANVPVAQGASTASADAAYRAGMAAAVADGQSKAEFLAVKVGGTLGPAQSVAEGGGYIYCTGPGESGEEYTGEQPDFGSGSVAGVRVVAGASTPALGGPAVKPRRHKRKHTSVKAAGSIACTLSTQVSLTYVID